MHHKDIVIVLGPDIENLDTRTYLAEGQLHAFPELAENCEKVLRPVHADKLAAAVLEIFEEAIRPDAQSQFIVTHAAAVVNLAGQFISEGRLSHEHVKVELYDAPTTTGLRLYRTFRFTRAGHMEADWPFGWFEADPAITEPARTAA